MYIELLEDAKSVKQCIECATVDANGEEELTAGWITCLYDIFEGVKTIAVLGDEVKFKGFDDINEMAVVAVCEKSKKKAKVSLDSIDTVKLLKPQRLWIKSYVQWYSY